MTVIKKVEPKKHTGDKPLPTVEEAFSVDCNFIGLSINIIINVLQEF